jgi:CBS domain-containing membrane protein
MAISLIVSDLMSRAPRTIRPDATVLDAYAIMTESAIRHLPVVSFGGELVGVVTHRDLLTGDVCTRDQSLLSEESEFVRDTLVAEVMTASCEVVSPETELSEAATILIANKIGCLPVMDGEELIGILTESDFVRYVLEEEIEAAEERIVVPRNNPAGH